MSLFSVTLIILSLLLKTSFAVQCASLDTQDKCSKNPSCDWSVSQSPPCYCAADAPLDVLFMLDESKSMKEAGFSDAKVFVKDMILDGLSQSSNIHIAKFSKRMRNVYNFTDDQTNNSLAATAVANTPYNKLGNTRTWDALKYTIKTYNKWKQHPNYSGNPPLFVLLTDGRPYPKPSSQYPNTCEFVKGLHDALGGFHTLLIGLGTRWRIDEIKCIITPGYEYGITPETAAYDTTRLITVADWSSTQFNQANVHSQAFLCPDAYSIKLTEIRTTTWNWYNYTYNSRFIEIYNDGNNDLDLSINNLRFDGFMTSEVFGVSGLSSCNITIPRETFAVFYDPNAPDLPMCSGCNCTLYGDNLWCNEALYIPCDQNSNTSGCGNCTWDTSMNNVEWKQEVYDYAADSIMTGAIRDASSTGYINIAEGYSHELRTLIAVIAPSNWIMSCNYTGTPGALPLDPCIRCVDSICKSQGDGDAYCGNSDGYDVCICNATNHYYLAGAVGCKLLSPVVDCTVTNSHDVDMDQRIAEITWDFVAGASYEVGTYFEVTEDKSTGKSTGKYAYRGYEIAHDEVVTVRAVYKDIVNGLVYSETETCKIITMAPSYAPTISPTESNADIDDCTVTVIGYNEVRVSWTDAYKGEPLTDINGPYTYYIYGYWNINDKENTFFDKYTTVTDETFRLKETETLDIGSNGEPEIYVVTQIENERTGGIDFERMRTDGQGKIKCDIKTSAPTKSPTINPSKAPTKSPTMVPTENPTLRPTYTAWTIDDCTVKIPGSNEPDSNLVDVTFDYIKPDERGTYFIHFIVNGKEEGTTGGTTDEFSLTDSAILDAINNNAFEAQIEYEEYPGSFVKTDIQKCRYITKAPTVSPTTDPTKAPTTDPTKYPTKTPTKAPSKTPTESPTYQKLPLPSPCSVTVNSGLTYLSIKFIETTFDDQDPNTPPLNDIFYLITIGPTLSDETEEYKIAAEISGAEKEYIIPSFEENEFVVDNDKTKVNIYIVDNNNNDIGDDATPLQCDVKTQRPTAAPTTPSPTAYPTTEHPEVRLDLVEKDEEGNIKIKDWGFDAESGINCIFPAGTRRRLQDDEMATTQSAELVNPCPNCPICTVKDNEDVKYIRMVRTPSYFKYDILVYVEILFLKDTDDEGISTKDFDYKSIHKQWHKLFGKTGSEKGTDILSIQGGSTDNRIDIEYYLDQIKENEDREPLEYFLVRIVSCSVDNSTGAITPFPSVLNNIYNKCYLGAYPSVIIAIEQKPEDGKFTQTTMGDMPMWVWYPIGFAAVAIPIVAYLIWRFYNAKKIADAMEIVRKHELGEAEKQDDVGEFGIVGDNITSNPLATGDAFEIPKGDVIIDHQLKLDKMNFEVATTDVERNIFKQDFGPVQAEKNHHL